MEENLINNFSIAGLYVRIIFNDTSINNMRLLPSFAAFKTESFVDKPFIQLSIDDKLTPISIEKRKHIRVFDTGNGDTSVDKLNDGGYQFIIKDIHKASCCLLQTNKDFSECKCALNGNYDMRCFGLNNALMLIFSFAGSFKDTLLIHASLVRQNGYGYAFTAKSGTGKSTHVSLWLQHIQGCDLMNDDNPIIRIINNKPYIYGSPWSGKTPCYRDIKAKLGAVVKIERATTNSVDKSSPIEAFTIMLPACSSMKWDKDIFNALCNTITKVIETTTIYTLHCLPNKEAALLCNKTISR